VARRRNGRILRSAILGLWRNGRELSLAEADPVTRSVAVLLAGALRPAPGVELQVAHAKAAAGREAIRSAIDQAVDTAAEVDVGSLCRAFGISRATLYRMFEPEGGLARYMRQRQLRRALTAIASPAHRHLRVLDIATQHGFRTESGFIRAFRRAFGATPSELRTAGGRQVSGGGGEPSVGPADPRDSLGWLLGLGSAADAGRSPAGGALG